MNDSKPRRARRWSAALFVTLALLAGLALAADPPTPKSTPASEPASEPGSRMAAQQKLVSVLAALVAAVQVVF